MKVLEYLSETIGPRVTGTQDEYLASQYIANVFESLGLNTKIQEFSFLNWFPKESPRLRIIEPKDMEIGVAPMSYTLPTPVKGVLGRVKKIGKMYIIPKYMEWPKYCIEDNEGCELGSFVANPNGPAVPMSNLKHVLPVVCSVIGNEDAEQLDTWLEQGREVRAFFFNTGIFEPACSQNVIGVLGKGIPQIVVCAHYDSVCYSPGAIDNASGVQVICDLVRRLVSENLSGLVPIAFIAMGCEEAGFLGSRYYVKWLKERGLLEKIRFCINFDMVGTGDFFVLRAGQGAGDELMGILEQSQVQTKYEIKVEMARPSTDNWSFEEENIPNVQVVSLPTSLYHQPADILDNVDPTVVNGAMEIGYELLRSLSSKE